MLESLERIDRELKRLDRLLPETPSQQASSRSAGSQPSDLQIDLTIEEILTGYDYAQIPASHLQRAICRYADGIDASGLLTVDESRKYFGCDEVRLDDIPQLIELVCGVRGGKSWLASCAAIHAALTADLSSLQTIEVPRFLIVAPKLELAEITFGILRGIVERSTVLSQLLDEPPTADTVVFRRPDCYRVEITVVAASRGGANVRGVWLVGFILEEVAQFGVESTGAVVNAEEILRAARTRLLPRCQGWLISSPYGPQGLLYDYWRKHFGKPGKILVCHAPTRALNPSFPQASIDEVAADDEDAAAREYGAEWVDADTAFLPGQSIDALTRLAPVSRAPMPGAQLSAAMDAATRGNAWTFVVAARERLQGGRERVAILDAWEFIGSKQRPLSPAQVLSESAPRIHAFGVRRIDCDQWSFDANRDHATNAGLELVEVSSTDTESGYARLKALIGSSDLELAPVENLKLDLKAIRKRGTAGAVKVVLPKQANGRHCDYAPSVAKAVFALSVSHQRPARNLYGTRIASIEARQ